jgi:hypothetical protein
MPGPGPADATALPSNQRRSTRGSAAQAELTVPDISLTVNRRATRSSVTKTLTAPAQPTGIADEPRSTRSAARLSGKASKPAARAGNTRRQVANVVGLEDSLPTTSRASSKQAVSVSMRLLAGYPDCL